MHEILQHLIKSFSQRRTLFATGFLFLFFAAIEFIFAYLELLPVSLFWLLCILLDMLLAGLCGWVLARPLALQAYLSEVAREQKRSKRLYTPLSGAKNLYETPTDETARPKQQDVHLLVRQNAHLLILGLPGAGKTMALRAYQALVLKYSWAMLWGRSKIPIYVPMKDYNVFLERIQVPQTIQGPGQEPPYPQSLLAYLLEETGLSGMKYLQPYLESLARQGRLRFLCDGLNELDSQHQDFVCAELVQTMRAKQNALVMTCRELDYREGAALQQLVGKDLAEEALILPLKLDQMHDFIKKYAEQQTPITHRHRYSAHEMMLQIEHSPLSYNCTNPMMLVNLIETIDIVGIDEDIKSGTRGRLLKKFIHQLIRRELERPVWQPLDESEIMTFLGQMACSARLRKRRNAIQLGHGAQQTQTGSLRTIPQEELAERLHLWLLGQKMPAGTAQRPYTQAEVGRLLDFAQSASLVTISHNGVLSFRHELVAEFFAGSYLHHLDTNPQGPVPFGDRLIQDVGAWSEPVVIWAGMSDDPVELARRLANLKQQNNPESAYNALTLSLACVGVVWRPPHPSQSTPGFTLPANVSQLLVSFVPNPDARSKLAATLKRCADEGGIEIYRSLLPLLMEDYIDDLLLEIDKQAVPDLLFDYLYDAVDSNLPENYLKHLVRLLGRFGWKALPRAAELSRDDTQQNVRLQTAALQILGYLGLADGVGLLIPHLGAEEEMVRTAAANALVQLGPDLALDRVIEELKSQMPVERIRKIHWYALAILRGFLGQSQLSSLQHQRIIEALLRALSSVYVPSVQQEAHRILLQQTATPTNTEDETWRRAVTLLIRSLDDQDQTRVSHVLDLLQQIGYVATPLLLHELSISRGEIVRVRIVEVLGTTRDPAALQPLIVELADSSPKVQAQVALALQSYTPTSIQPLIQCVKTYVNQQVARRAGAVLIQIGKECAEQVIQALWPLVPGRVAILLDVLVALGDVRAIGPILYILEPLQNDPTLAILFIQAIGHFPDVRVVSALMKILLSWTGAACDEAQKVLSQFGLLAFPLLLEALDAPADQETSQRVRTTLLYMDPFPDEQVLNALSDASEAQVRQLELLFLEHEGSAPFLVQHLSHQHARVRMIVLGIVEALPWPQVTRPLLDALQNPRDLNVVTSLLLRDKSTIPLLVRLLDDQYRSNAAVSVLLKFGTIILSALVPALNHTSLVVRNRARGILEMLVRQAPEGQARQNVLTQIVGLFALLTSSTYGWSGLLDVLCSREFSTPCIPVLLKGLADIPRLQEGCIDAFVRLVRKRDDQSEQVLQALLDALSVEEQRTGAANALIQLGGQINDLVSERIVESMSQRIFASPADSTAQNILSEIGAPALDFVWSTYRHTDENLQHASHNIFRNMPTEKIKDRLVDLLTSETPLNAEKGLVLLLERVLVEGDRPVSEQGILAVLLKHVQAQKGERSTARILALLLLSQKDMVIKYMTQALAMDHKKWLVQVFLLLGIEGSEALQALKDILNNGQMIHLHAEVSGILGMLPHSEPVVEDYVTLLSQFNFIPISDRATKDLAQQQELNVSLRALGGLLASGSWDVRKLQGRWLSSAEDSPERDLYTVLLGGAFSQQIKVLKDDLQNTMDDNMRKIQDLNRDATELKKKLRQKDQKIGDLNLQVTDLRNQVASLRKTKDQP